MKEIIKTIYDGKEQFWLASIDEEEFTLLGLMGGCGSFNMYPVTKYVEKLRSTNWQWMAVTFTPITEDNFDAYFSRAYHRGHEDDKEPFMLRKKRIPELTVKIHNHTYKMGCISVYPYSRRETITPGQVKWINEKFGAQLAEAYNESLINHLVDRAIDRMKNTISDKLCEMRTNSNRFEQIIFNF